MRTERAGVSSCRRASQHKVATGKTLGVFCGLVFLVANKGLADNHSCLQGPELLERENSTKNRAK